MRRIDRGAAGADDIFRLDRDFRSVMGRVFAKGAVKVFMGPDS
jgi:hypothetical protein